MHLINVEVVLWPLAIRQLQDFYFSLLKLSLLSCFFGSNIEHVGEPMFADLVFIFCYLQKPLHFSGRLCHPETGKH